VTLANKITLCRIGLVPAFIWCAGSYGSSVAGGAPQEGLRWAALALFIIASASDGLDGWIARRWQQQSRLGRILDPIADKSLLLGAIITLTLVDWGPAGWTIPSWFLLIVLTRDGIIIGMIGVLQLRNGHVRIRPHWSGKICVAAQMVVLAWIMLRWIPLSPLYPCLFAAAFCFWSGGAYILEAVRQWQHDGADP
jgi:CDP-diacylglycerol--glycerol-3-phosphate 3-phosphatidyltransferase